MKAAVALRLMSSVLAAAIAALTPARAASITTEVFVAVVSPKVAFLQRSAALAEANTGSARLRAFARTEIRDQARAERDLAAWREVARARQARDAAASTLDGLGPVAHVVTTPFAAVADAASVASPPLTPLPSEHRIEAANDAEARHLATLRGANFDAAFQADQLGTLKALVAIYKDFILNGDDETLRAMAVHNLPRVEHLLASIRR